MKLRRITSMTLLLSLIFEVLTSVILYIVPRGRVAYWSEWKLWGLSKNQWGDLHINLGLLMIIAGGFHVYYNWKPITNYMKNKAREFRMFTPDFNVALIVVLLFSFGTWLQVPPLVWVIDLGEHFSDQAALTLGEPPYGHAEESSLRVFLRNTGQDPRVAKNNLATAGVEISDPELPILDLAHANGMTPQQLYEAMQGPKEQRPTAPMPIPGRMPKGSGRLSLTTFCGNYNLDVAESVLVLEAAGWSVDPTLTLKAIAAANGEKPLDLLDVLRAAER